MFNLSKSENDEFKKKKRTEETSGAEQNFNESCASWPSGPISPKHGRAQQADFSERIRLESSRLVLVSGPLWLLSTMLLLSSS